MNTAKNLRVRRAGADDAATLATLRFEFRSALGAAVESREEFVTRCTEWMRFHLTPGAGWAAWLLENSTGEFGAIWLQLIEKIPNPVVERELHGYITNLFVRESKRGLGGGSLLLGAAIGECQARDVDTIILWPTPRSRSLYERHGFSTTSAVMAKVL